MRALFSGLNSLNPAKQKAMRLIVRDVDFHLIRIFAVFGDF